MFYLPPQEIWYLTAIKLKAVFDDGSESTGTGFFIVDDKDNYALVTARHVVDPKYRPSSLRREAACTDLSMYFHIVVNAGTEQVNVRYHNLKATDPEWTFDDDDLDLAVLPVPTGRLPHTLENGDVVRPVSFPPSMLAGEEALATRYAGEPVMFYGFPRYAPNKVLGKAEIHYPILRQGVFAYPPNKGIEIEGAIGSDYGLIDSFAQSGFSGGPIVSLQKGWGDGTWHPAKQHQPAKLVGLICGHYRDSEDRSDGVHSGLSYFVRSNAIRNAAEKAGLVMS